MTIREKEIKEAEIIARYQDQIRATLKARGGRLSIFTLEIYTHHDWVERGWNVHELDTFRFRDACQEMRDTGELRKTKDYAYELVADPNERQPYEPITTPY